MANKRFSSNNNQQATTHTLSKEEVRYHEK